MPKMGVTCSKGMETVTQLLSCQKGLLLLGPSLLWDRIKGQNMLHPEGKIQDATGRVMASRGFGLRHSIKLRRKWVSIPDDHDMCKMHSAHRDWRNE